MERVGWNFDNLIPKSIYDNVNTLNENHFKQSTIDFDSSEQDKCFRKSAIIHRIVRNEVKQLLVPGAKYLDIVEFVEKRILELRGQIAFPVGLNVNNIAAHDSAYPCDERILEDGDIVKIDIGVHIDGNIIDSAFTHIIGDDDKYKPLLDATMDATYTGISLSGVDTRLIEISEGICEVINSYEFMSEGELCRINPISNLGGHNILPYQIHGGKLILCVPNKAQEGMKMEENEIYAIETFASTGTGVLKIEKDFEKVTHYQLDKKSSVTNFTKYVKEYRGTLPFANRWSPKFLFSQELFDSVKYKNVMSFPPLYDTNGTYTSQFEHTIKIKENGCIEIFSLGEDY